MSFTVETIFYHALITIYHFISYEKKKKKKQLCTFFVLI